MPTQNGRRRNPPLDAAEGRDKHRARRIDEVHGHELFGRRHFRPFANPADMSGIAQRDRGQAGCFGLLDTDRDGLRRNGLAETIAPIEHSEGWRVDQRGDRLVRHDVATLDPSDIARHANDAVAVVSGEIGADKRPGDALAFILRGANADENVRDERGKRLNLYRDHQALVAACPPPR